MNARSSLARSNTIVTPILTLALLAGGCAVDTSSPGDAPDDAVDPTEELGEVDSAMDSALWSDDFGHKRGWRTDRHLRDIADVDGDGLLDAVGFNDTGVLVAKSLNDRFDVPTLWTSEFSYDKGYRSSKHPRYLADINADTRADIVSFYEDGIWVAKSIGDRFEPAELWLGDFGYGRGWRADRHIRRVIDVDNDRRADVVAIGDDGVRVAFAHRASFTEPQLMLPDFGAHAGWSYKKHIVDFADFDGDGYMDIGGIRANGVYVSRFDGSKFLAPVRWTAHFGDELGRWRMDRHPRYFADVNGDGRADVIGFHDIGPFVALSNGTGFGAPSLWGAFFGHTVGNWRVDKHVRRLLDIDGDHKLDLVGVHDDGVWVSMSLGNRFTEPVLRIQDFHRAGGWDPRRHLRLFGRLTHERMQAICGFGDAGVYVKELW
jgi:hypothetical protein